VGDNKVAASDSGLGLRVDEWAAIVHHAGERKVMGAAAEVSTIPANQRRRMPAFILDAALCSLPLLQSRPESDLVYCSCYGDLGITVELLTDLLRKELLSPAKFSISVHNAPAGMIGLALNRIGNHTAVAAGADSLASGLTEAYARLASGEADCVVLLHAEAQLPPIYREFDQDGPSIFLALSLNLRRGGDKAYPVSPGRAGAAALARTLERGARDIVFTPPVAAMATA
jgi:hypothetical protein